jgi:hypothetical protein
MTNTIEESAPYLLGVEVTDNSANQTTAAQPPAKAPRARRSDYGTKKPPKVPAEATGRITKGQAAHIDKLRVEFWDALTNEDAVKRHADALRDGAKDASLVAERAYYSYLEEITTKS